MTVWPEAHPRRFCKLCGLPVYRLWVGDTPPPGTCPRDAGSAKTCPDVLNRLVLGHDIAEGEKRPVHPEHLALMHRCGITPETIAGRREFNRTRDAAATMLMIDDAAWIKGLRDWLFQPGTTFETEARFIALVAELAGRIDYCAADERLMEIYDRAEQLAQAAAEAIRDAHIHGDYETEAEPE